MTNETTNEQEVLLLRRKLDLLLRTGKMLMESAADTNRIERNMKRVAAYLGIPEEKLHIDIRWTMLMVNVSDEKHSFPSFKNVKSMALTWRLFPKSVNCHGEPSNRIIRWISMKKNWKRLLIRNVIILLTLLPSVPGLPVADSVNCLAGTGLLS